MDNKLNIIGREHEQEVLRRCYESPKAEFIAIYGRRRIGKTYLVKQYFTDQFDFYATGIYKVSRAEQLKQWQAQLQQYSGQKRPRPKDWYEAFGQLREYLLTLSDKARLVLFIDELPWMDTPKSGFIRALEMFWNSWAADRPGLKLIVCGSATTWMTNKLLGDKGGLHNRVTRPIRLAPFTLGETERYLKSLGMDWSRGEVLDAYMILGGTPFYLSLLNPELSMRQNVDELFFSKDDVMNREYDSLFASLFHEAATYRRIIELLATKMKGMTRAEIVAGLNKDDGGLLSEALDNLEKCDFIRRYQAFGKKQRDMIYQLTDMYILFYLRFVKSHRGMNDKAWSTMAEGKRSTWEGYAFEQVCILHLAQIRKGLGIDGVASDACSWSKTGEGKGAQIDLVIDRGDKVINLCEMKFSTRPFELTAEYAEWMQQRRDLFVKDTKTTKSTRLTLVSPYGVAKGKHTSILQGVLTLDDLFA